MKDIKLIAIDLDGTWLRSDCSISENTKKAVTRAIEAGYLVVPTTGRSYRNARAVLRDIPGLRYFINANGATVADAGEEKMIYAEAIPYEISSQVFAYARQYDCFMELYEAFDAHVDQAGKKYLAGIGLSENYIEQLMSTNIMHEDLDVFMSDPARNISKFHIVCGSEEIKDELKDKIASLQNCHPISVFHLNIELVNGLWGKAGGLLKLAEHLGLSADNIMAIGDSNNDLDMLKWAGTSVVMGNAPDHVKKLADYVTAENDQDGVAKALEEILDIRIS